MKTGDWGRVKKNRTLFVYKAQVCLCIEYIHSIFVQLKFHGRGVEQLGEECSKNALRGRGGNNEKKKLRNIPPECYRF